MSDDHVTREEFQKLRPVLEDLATQLAEVRGQLDAHKYIVGHLGRHDRAKIAAAISLWAQTRVEEEGVESTTPLSLLTKARSEGFIKGLQEIRERLFATDR